MQGMICTRNVHRVAHLRLLGLMLLALLVAACQEQAGSAPGEVARWDELLSAARKEAGQFSSRIVLWQVKADFTRSQLQEKIAVPVSFTFVKENGEAILVELEDSSPPLVLQLKDRASRNPVAVTEVELRRVEGALASVKLGPREIAQRLANEGAGFPRGPLVNLNLAADDTITLGVQVVYLVSFRSEDNLDGTTLVVAPDTAEILGSQ